MAQNNEMRRITLKMDTNLNSIHQRKTAVTFRLHAAKLEVLIAIKATYMRQLVHAGRSADLDEYSSHIAYNEFRTNNQHLSIYPEQKLKQVSSRHNR